MLPKIAQIVAKWPSDRVIQAEQFAQWVEDRKKASLSRGKGKEAAPPAQQSAAPASEPVGLFVDVESSEAFLFYLQRNLPFSVRKMLKTLIIVRLVLCSAQEGTAGGG